MRIAMNPRIVRLTAGIDEFKGYWRGLKNLSPERLRSLRRLATIESIGSSTRIEGAGLNDHEVAAIIEDLDARSFRTRDEQEVAGYAKTIERILESHDQIDLTENHIQQLHRELLRFSEKDQWHLGKYKTHPNHVAAFDAEGKIIGIVFETASPFDTPMMMSALVERARRLLDEKEFHPLLVIADFVLRFLAIHPFQDGNGRLSRILTNLMLLRHGYEFVAYSSHERIVEANKDHYYQALRSNQKGIFETENLSEGWVEFFLQMLTKQKDELETKIRREQKALKLPALSMNIVEMVRQHGRVSVSFLTVSLGDNRNTVKKHLQALVNRGLLERRGKGRGTYYIIAAIP